MSERKNAAVQQFKKNASSAGSLGSQLANDEAFANAVGDLVELDPDSKEYSEIAARPKKYFDSRQAGLPPDANITMRRTLAEFTVEVCVLDHCVTVTVQILT